MADNNDRDRKNIMQGDKFGILRRLGSLIWKPKYDIGSAVELRKEDFGTVYLVRRKGTSEVVELRQIMKVPTDTNTQSDKEQDKHQTPGEIDDNKGDNTTSGTDGKPKHVLSRRLRRPVDKHDANIQNEVDILKMCNSSKDSNKSYIIKFHESFESDRHFYIVTEHLDRKPVLDELMKRSTLYEKDVIAAAKDMLHALKFVHELGIIQRHVTPEAFRYRKEDDGSEVRLRLVLVDFKYAQYKDSPKDLPTPPCNRYSDPKIVRAWIQGKKKKKARDIAGIEVDGKMDVWGVGVIVHVLLTGHYPYVDHVKKPKDEGKSSTTDSATKKPKTYYHENGEAINIDKTYLVNVVDKQVQFLSEHEYWRGVSPKAKDFLHCVHDKGESGADSSGLLHRKKLLRTSIVNALNHSWLTDFKPSDIDLPGLRMQAGRIKRKSEERRYRRPFRVGEGPERKDGNQEQHDMEIQRTSSHGHQHDSSRRNSDFSFKQYSKGGSEELELQMTTPLDSPSSTAPGSQKRREKRRDKHDEIAKKQPEKKKKDDEQKLTLPYGNERRRRDLDESGSGDRGDRGGGYAPM
ncbi:kinase-like protein [Fomitiporia mediterranea MF3/22]|uniref:kinase-like protein n=1 Tax=Fomitiporia mediterranea (strain MF3/22) TaxID=694068 RepID=UPI0004407E3C|nr:kinase-like protein [Fomitiporia mediterranea MF3/22]EJD01744.1 kinase-like protein [Fomitiporia mediterranea MF3/22]